MEPLSSNSESQLSRLQNNSRMNELIMILTTRCNQHCVFCCEPPGDPDMDTENVKKWLDLIYLSGIPWVDFSGGEPLLHPNLIEIIQYSKSIGLRNTISTNGQLTINFINKIFQNVDQWNLSLHGTESIHNEITQNHKSYQNIITVCKKLSKIGAIVHITYVVTPKNIYCIKPSLEALIDCGVTKICFNYVFKRGQGSKYLQDFELSQDEAIEIVSNVINGFTISNMTIYHNYNLDGQCALVRSNGQVWSVPMSNNLDYEETFCINQVEKYAKEYLYMENHKKFTFPRLGPV